MTLPWMDEGLEFEGVAGRVEAEHRPLLPGLVGEPSVGGADELDVGTLEPSGQAVELLDVERHAEVRDGYVMTVYRVVPRDADASSEHEVGDDLVAEEVPVHPGVGVTTLPTAEHLPVEAAGGAQVVDRRARWNRGRGLLMAHPRTNEPARSEPWSSPTFDRSPTQDRSSRRWVSRWTDRAPGPTPAPCHLRLGLPPVSRTGRCVG